MHKISFLLALAAAAVLPLHAQDDCKSAILKRLKVSGDFSLKVADAMPESDYNFKLTAPQMSFAEQIVHLSQGLTYFLSVFKGEEPNPAKPPSMSKGDVIAYTRSAFDQAIETVSALTPAQLAKDYKMGRRSMTGDDILIAMLEHTAHHRASAEMYLRAKGITPPAYME